MSRRLLTERLTGIERLKRELKGMNDKYMYIVSLYAMEYEFQFSGYSQQLEVLMPSTVCLHLSEAKPSQQFIIHTSLVK